MNLDALLAKAKARMETLKGLDPTDPLTRFISSAAVRDANEDIQALIRFIKEKGL